MAHVRQELRLGEICAFGGMARVRKVVDAALDRFAAEGERAKLALPGEPPAGMERKAIDRESGLLAAPGAPGLTLWFREGTAPTEISGNPGTSPTDFGRTSREF